jgi:hypothetical protein
MFQSLAVFRRKRRSFAPQAVSLPMVSAPMVPAEDLRVMLEMPMGSEGQMVPTGTVIRALLWQHYGLDLLHPEVSRWLEQHAPDVKYAVAENRFASGSDGAEFRVGSNGMMKVSLSPKVDDRLREVSSRYLMTQLRYSKPQQQH